MARLKGSGKFGPTRSVRLPFSLDRWFEQRVDLKPELSASELLTSLVHGGLRLRDGYMSVHRSALERLARSRRHALYKNYISCLNDTFGPAYVQHLERWLEADAISDAADKQAPPPGRGKNKR
jgi:hypothetical protein